MTGCIICCALVTTKKAYLASLFVLATAGLLPFQGIILNIDGLIIKAGLLHSQPAKEVKHT